MQPDRPRIWLSNLIEDIDGAEQWPQRRDELLRRVEEALGQPSCEPVPLNARTLDETDCGTYVRRKVVYDAEADEIVPAWLLTPKNIAGPTPAILCLHQTTPHGKDEPAGLAGSPDLHYAAHLAERGYITLAPDHVTVGERNAPGHEPFDTALFYARHPHWSAMGKAIWDARVAVDYLCSLPEVGAENLGCIGHSLGGHGALFAAAFDERVKAGVANCGAITLAETPRRLEWARDHWYVYFPALRPLFLAGEPAPFDFHEVLALIAPRAFLNITALNDECFAETDSLAEACVRVNKVYRMLEAEDNFAMHLHGCGHGFRRDVRELAYAWLDERLCRR